MVWGFVKPQHFAKHTRNHTFARKDALGFGVFSLIFFVLVGVTTPPTQKPATVQLSTASSTTHTQTSKPKNAVTTKQTTETQTIPFTATTQNDAALTKGQTKITQAGQNGVETFTYKITYTDGQQTNKTLMSQAATTPMVPEIIENGTYVAPPPVVHPTPQTSTPSDCTNGTYVNSAGNTVCSPETAPSAPAGATAKCNDGTYSFSQTHSGTCSHHGGVAEWL